MMRNRLILIVFVCCFGWLGARAQSYENAQEHQCLKCHSNQTYTFHNDLMERQESRLMNPYFVLDTIALNAGVHHVFDCIDCHSYEYTTYPHSANIKLEPLATCLDCHGYDESFAKYQFERIDEEYQKSVHYQTYGDAFTCSKCHSQHTYTATARTSSNVQEIVEYSNNMCLSCHNSMQEYKLVSGKDNPELVEVHNWLPNQKLHFENVRCIECHTEVEDSLMVSHNILPKEQALRKCVECHSSNSRLIASLYKYENLQSRKGNGVLGTMVSNDSYVIGTHQVPLLKTLSYIIFIGLIVVIIIHTIFRILNRKPDDK